MAHPTQAITLNKMTTAQNEIVEINFPPGFDLGIVISSQNGLDKTLLYKKNISNIIFEEESVAEPIKNSSIRGI